MAALRHLPKAKQGPTHLATQNGAPKNSDTRRTRHRSLRISPTTFGRLTVPPINACKHERLSMSIHIKCKRHRQYSRLSPPPSQRKGFVTLLPQDLTYLSKTRNVWLRYTNRLGAFFSSVPHSQTKQNTTQSNSTQAKLSQTNPFSPHPNSY